MELIGVLAFAMAGCHHPFEPRYDPAGVWTDAVGVDVRGCPDDLLDGLRVVSFTGAFPPYGSTETEQGTLTVLGLGIDVNVVSASSNRPPKGVPLDSGSEDWNNELAWTLSAVVFKSGTACDNCDDALVLTLATDVNECGPVVTYLGHKGSVDS